MEKIINPSLRDEIELKQRKIESHPGEFLQRQKIIARDLASIGDAHSYWIENPQLRKALLTHGKSEKTIKKQAREGIRAVKDGWGFLVDKPSPFVNLFVPHDLERLNALVYRPGARVFRPKPGERFRTCDVTLNVPGYRPAKPHLIPEEVQKHINLVQKMYIEDPLEAAIFAHLGIAAIQPFEDGNKRCARLVQDRILMDADLPPAVIPAGEAKFYLEAFTSSLKPYKDGNMEGQREFFNYIASKVNNGLDEILNDLRLDIPNGSRGN